MYMLPELPYSYDSLEPFIDAETVELHYSKHHQTYLDKLNAALEKYPNLPDRPILELIRNSTDIPDDIQTVVKNMGGGYFNHNLYWSTLTPKGTRSVEFEGAILNNWGSWSDFKADFTNKAATFFGSGWVWLVKNNVGKFSIVQLPNQDVPEGKLLVAIDVWEHAYYLKYQNRRAEYIEAWWSLVDWKEVYNNYMMENGQLGSKL